MGSVLGGGGGKRPTETSTTSTNMDPAYLEFLNKAYGMAGDIASKPYEGYTGPGVAGPDPSMTNALNMMGGSAIHGNKNMDTIIKNIGLAGGNMGPKFNPVINDGTTTGFVSPEITSTYTRPDISQSAYNRPDIVKNAFTGPELNRMTAGDYSTAIEARMNPYQDQVVDATMRDIERQRQMQLNTDAASAVAANAFGGSRHGLVEAETNRAANQQAIDATARLRQQGYDTALASVDSEQDRIQKLLLERAKSSAADTRTGEGLLVDSEKAAASDIRTGEGLEATTAADASNAAIAETGLKLDAATTGAKFDMDLLGMKLQQAGMSADDAQKAAQYGLDALIAQGQLEGMTSDQQMNAIMNMFNMGGVITDNQNAQNAFDFELWKARQNDPYNKLGAMTGVLGAPTPTTTTSTTVGSPQRTNPIGAMMGGAASGAAMGTSIMPGKGTIIGGAIGGGLGLLSSLG